MQDLSGSDISRFKSTPVGRPIGSSKDPISLNEKTKQKYARKLTNEFKEKIEKLSLKDQVLNGLMKDFDNKKGISALTENDVIKLAQDKTISDATLQYILQVIRTKIGRGAVTSNMRIALKTRKTLFDVDDEKNDDENREQKAKSWGLFIESCQALQ